MAFLRPRLPFLYPLSQPATSFTFTFAFLGFYSFTVLNNSEITVGYID